MSELYGASETSVVKVIAGSEAIVFNNQVCSDSLPRTMDGHESRPCSSKSTFRVLQENYPNQLIMDLKQFMV